jgi:YidC/Oxa1 family membrane protein insertase
MERRVLIAIFLSFIVLYAYQALVVKPTSKAVSPGAASSTSASTKGAGVVPGGGTVTTPATSVALQSHVNEVVSTTVVGDSTERDIRIETRDIIAVFTNRGARLKSWRLKKYRDQQQQPQELIENQPAYPLPFTLRTADEQLNTTLNESLYSASTVPTTVIAAPTDLRFEYRNEAGVRAVKEFHMIPDSYIIEFRADVAVGDRAVSPAPAIVWGPGVGDIAEVSRYTQKAEGLFFQSGKAQRLSAKDIVKQPSYDGEFLFAGVDDNYFMTVALPMGAIRIAYQAVAIPPPPPSKDAPRDLVSFSIEPKGAQQQVKFFAGPKDFDVLAALGPDVTRAINFGTFAVIVVPLLKSLKWVNSYVGNYGWSIIILTVIINIVIFPLRHKSVVSMRKMQEIQPEVKSIQDRYAKLKATDPAKQKMNQELMALYKDRGVNPASGCVPILLTFPLIFAFYALLSTAIELRGAPFLGWIHDLSAHDPFYVTPVLMGASQLWQQWMMPAAGVDPAQQKMMMFMPIMFTFMFLWAPSGLAIYWLVSNVWQIGQQYLTNYIIGPPAVRTLRPAAERRLRRVGGGKTDAADANNKT